MRYQGNVVTESDTRAKGAGTPEKCFYCKGKTGGPHDAECVCIQRPVKIRVTLELIVSVPRSWDKDGIEFHRNESSWCADNMTFDLRKYTEATGRCLCAHQTTEYVGEATLEEAIEVGMIPDSETDEPDAKTTEERATKEALPVM